MIQNPSPTRGAALTLAILFLTAASILVVGGVMTPAYQAIRSAHELARSEESYFFAEGLLEDVLYRMREDVTVGTEEVLSEASRTATATVTAIGGTTIQEIISRGERQRAVRKARALLDTGSGASFSYGVQAGDGGIILDNSSSVSGNAFSNGPIVGAGLNDITGTAISATSTGLIDDIRVGEDAHAHTIRDSIVVDDAFYQVISGTTVSGTSYPGSPDQATSSLPISDGQIASWEADAEAGGVTSSPCPYKPANGSVLGPRKITCDVEFKNVTVTIAGAVWVTGKITIKGSTIQIDPALGKKSVPIIADNLANRLTSSTITLETTSSFAGSGAGNSYVLLLSQNNSAETGGLVSAIDVQQTSSGDLLVYAGHGRVSIAQSTSLKEVTAYLVHLKNSARAIYESGLANMLFVSGPSGGYIISNWREEE
jgi:hypothetical protein